MQEICFFSPMCFFIQSFIYHYSLMDIYFIFHIIIQHNFCYFIAQMALALAIGSFHLAPASLGMPPLLCFCLFVWYFLIFCYCKVLQAYLVYFLSSSRISHLSQDKCSSYWKMVSETKMWELVLLIFVIFLSYVITECLACNRFSLNTAQQLCTPGQGD